MSSDIKTKLACGIVMPIAAMDDCPESHWAEVKQIIVSVVEELNYECKLVSEEVDVGVIHKRIVQNLYENDLIICDVSCRNANVMFELGMRLAFDKPVIIIKDDKTPYSFDTSPVEHLTYRRDLRFGSVNEFKDKLAAKIEAVLHSQNASSFLSSFGSFKTAEIKRESVEPYELIMEEISSLRKLVSQNSIYSGEKHGRIFKSSDSVYTYSMTASKENRVIVSHFHGTPEAVSSFIADLPMNGISEVSLKEFKGDTIVEFTVEESFDVEEMFKNLAKIIRPRRTSISKAGSN